MYSYSDIKKIYSLGKTENSIKIEYPELNVEFAQDVSEFDTFDEYKEDV